MATVIPEGCDITYHHMKDKEYSQPSEIQRFYSGSSILITGATGFLGSLLLEKLLRACPGIVQIYLMLRSKRGETPRERLSALINGIMFERLKLEQPDFWNKITIISGDCATAGLALSEFNRKRLITNVNVVFHVAATVKFNETLKRAVSINVRGTRDILGLARGMKNLKAFLYVSTAYSHCVQSNITETFYSVNITSDRLIALTEILNDEQLEHLTPLLLQNWPNTYVYTKAITEDLLRSNTKGLPIAIIRPSIVLATKDEPIAGWTNTLYGTSGITVSVGLGFLRTLHCKPEVLADMVPADYCVNAMIAAASKINENPENVKFDELNSHIPIYNFVASCQAPITWQRYMALGMAETKQVASPLFVWYPCFRLNSNKLIHILSMYLLHLLPGYLIDFICVIKGLEPKMVKQYKMIHKSTEYLSYFTLRQWQFSNENVQSLWQQLNEIDKHLFEFDMRLFNWDTYMHTYARGLRVYLLKDPLETVPEGMRKYKQLRIAHYCLVTVVTLLLLKLILITMSALFNL